jgi:phosphoribosylformimino-5-aminoimidazole carboxamide ribotide isomerase
MDHGPCPALQTMTIFRPCIDLHQGQVKQIVGGTLTDSGQGLRTNFVAEHDSRWFAGLYREDSLQGGHVIMLGPGNREAALQALRAFPGGLQVGGGLDDTNALPYLEAGASHVILTSWLFPGGSLSMERLGRISRLVGRERLVVDLSCRRVGDGWFVAMDRWQTVTEVRLDAALLESLAGYCDEFLIHAADVEGKCEGMDWELVHFLANSSPLPTTYAGGARDLSDLSRLEAESGGRLDLSIGSALDIFGGSLVRYADCAAFNRGRTPSGRGPRGEADPSA